MALTKSQAPANRPTKMTADDTCRRRGIRCRSTGEVRSRAAKPSTMPAATLSCRPLSTLSGTQPTSARLTPITVRNSCAEVAAPRRAPRRPTRTRSRRTRSPYTTTSAPEILRVLLNSAPDRSWNVPRRLKCRCHHSGSVVVAMDSSTPPLSTISTARATCIVLTRDTRRPGKRAREAERNDGRVTVRTALIRVDSTHGERGVPYRRAPLTPCTPRSRTPDGLNRLPSA